MTPPEDTKQYVEMFYDGDSETVCVYATDSPVGSPCLEIPREALRWWALVLLALDNEIADGPILLRTNELGEPESAQGWFGTLQEEA